VGVTKRADVLDKWYGCMFCLSTPGILCYQSVTIVLG
jgi:hypothetical protein